MIMEKIRLGVEELIFCLYSEGQFEQGMFLKQSYFPNLTDEQLELVFQTSTRSLLAKDLLYFEENQYKLKSNYRPMIQSLNFAEFTIKASKIGIGEDDQNRSFHVKSEKEYYSHQMFYDNQVHELIKYDSKEEATVELIKFMNLKFEEYNDVKLHCQNKDFESILKGVTRSIENNEGIHELIRFFYGKNESIEFLQDLRTRDAKMDTLIRFVYGQDNTPEVSDMTFIVPGTSCTWIISDTMTNQFKISKLNKEILSSMFVAKEYAK